MATLAMVWETLVQGLMAGLKQLRLRHRTTPSSLQIHVSGDHNAVNVVLPGTGSGHCAREFLRDISHG